MEKIQITIGQPMRPMKISPFKTQMISTRKEIKHLEDIDTTTPEGKMLFAAMVPLTTEINTNKTPNQVLSILNEIKKTIPFDK